MFAGYGISAPDVRIRRLRALNVKGKAVLIFCTNHRSAAPAAD